MLYSEQELCRVVRAMLKSIHLLVCLLVQDSGVLAVLDQLGVNHVLALDCTIGDTCPGQLPFSQQEAECCKFSQQEAECCPASSLGNGGSFGAGPEGKVTKGWGRESNFR